MLIKNKQDDDDGTTVTAQVDSMIPLGSCTNTITRSPITLPYEWDCVPRPRRSNGGR